MVMRRRNASLIYGKLQTQLTTILEFKKIEMNLTEQFIIKLTHAGTRFTKQLTRNDRRVLEFPTLPLRDKIPDTSTPVQRAKRGGFLPDAVPLKELGDPY